MTIQHVEFDHPADAETERPNTVRLRGTDTHLTFDLVADRDRVNQLYKSGDRLIGWLGVELVAAEPRDIEGAKFDLVGIARLAPTAP